MTYELAVVWLPSRESTCMLQTAASFDIGFWVKSFRRLGSLRCTSVVLLTKLTEGWNRVLGLDHDQREAVHEQDVLRHQRSARSRSARGELLGYDVVKLSRGGRVLHSML